MSARLIYECSSMGAAWRAMIVGLLGAVLVLAAAWPAAAEGAIAAERVSTVFINPGKRGDVFWDMIVDTMQAAAAHLRIDLEVIYAERSSRLMQVLGMSVVKRPVQPQLLILSNEDNAGVPILEAANAAGIRTLLISNDVAGRDKARLLGPRVHLSHWVGSLMPDIEAAGVRMAEKLTGTARRQGLQAADGRLHILVLAGAAKSPSGFDWERGASRFLKTQPDVVTDRTLVANWNANDAEELTENYIAWAKRKNIRVAGVLAGNDPMALGAIKAIRSAGLKPGHDVLVAGLNWSPHALASVQAGEMLLTDGGHFLMGLWSMIMLRDMVDGCDGFAKGKPTLLPMAFVTRKSADAVLSVMREGFFQKLDVDRLRAKAGNACRPYDFSLYALFQALPVTGWE